MYAYIINRGCLSENFTGKKSSFKLTSGQHCLFKKSRAVSLKLYSVNSVVRKQLYFDISEGNLFV